MAPRPDSQWFEVLGARGSIPSSGPNMDAYGGTTSSFAVSIDDETTVLFDAGTGLSFAPQLARSGHDYHVFFTHFHLDHVMGLPFFTPIYDPDSTFTFYGRTPRDVPLADAVGGTFRPPWFPVCFGETPSAKTFVALGPDPVEVADVSVRTVELNHPQGCLGFRVERGGSSVVLATDHEAGDREVDERLRRFAERADVLIHDAQYTPDQYRQHVGWGHSTYVDAASAATAAGVGSLVLTSHDPRHDDQTVAEIVGHAAEHFPDVVGACPGMRLPRLR